MSQTSDGNYWILEGGKPKSWMLAPGSFFLSEDGFRVGLKSMCLEGGGGYLHDKPHYLVDNLKKVKNKNLFIFSICLNFLDSK